MPPVLEADRLEERAADALDDRALDLVAQAVGIDDRAALERGRRRGGCGRAPDGFVDLDLGAGGDVAALLVAAGDAEAAAAARPARFAQPNLSAAASKTALSRGSERFFSRNASGSIPSSCASSSMWLSRAKWFAVAASARYEPWRSGDLTGWNWIFWFATSYGVAMPAGPEL